MFFEMKSHLPQEALEPGTEISRLFCMLPQHSVPAITIIFHFSCITRFIYVLHSHLTLTAGSLRNHALVFLFYFLSIHQEGPPTVATHWMSVLLLKMLKPRPKSLQALDE